MPCPTLFKHIALLSVLTLTIAACQPVQEPQNIGETGKAVTIPAAIPLPEALPEGVELQFPYHFIKKENIIPASGPARLRYTVEYLSGSPDSIAKSLASSVKAAGFLKVSTRHLEDGRIHLIANKPGYGRLQAAIVPSSSQKLEHLQAAGTVSMGWPLHGAKAAAKH
ncbi:hypothetical protein [Marilutibacter maris]|uniref:hypothetical protein n=1 Tax=Marilutibacter maris TaxID=1605891 RepID=UPI000DAA96E2|nr:hypothetical protein [Lysobacter maris]